MRRGFAWLRQQLQTLGAEASRTRAPELIRAREDTPAWNALCEGHTKRLGRRVLREEVELKTK